MEVLYEVILPHLANEPLATAINRCKDDPALEYRTPQRAEICYFRCVVEVGSDADLCIALEQTRHTGRRCGICWSASAASD